MTPRPRLLVPVQIVGWDWPQVLRTCQGNIGRSTTADVYLGVQLITIPIRDPLDSLRVWAQSELRDRLPFSPEGAPP